MAGESSDSKITLARPEAGQTLQVAVLPGRTYVLEFEPETASYDLRDENIRLCFEDGAVLSLNGFFQATAQSDITLELRDGTLFSGKDVAEALTMDLTDFHTDNTGGEKTALEPGAPSAAAWDTDGLGNLLESGGAPAHLCDGHSVCTLFDEALDPHIDRDPQFALPASPGLTPPIPHERLPPAALPEQSASPAQPQAGSIGEILQWEDLLDADAPLPLGEHGGEPRFERICTAFHGEDMVRTEALNAPSLADRGPEDADQWLLAFLHMGSS